jgi:hypothetical protein
VGIRHWLYRALRLGELVHFFSWLLGLGLLGVLLSAVAGLSQVPLYSKIGIGVCGLAALVGGLGIVAPHIRPVVNVDLVPSGGPSPDLRLAVTNRGHSDEFSARATVMRTRNDPNPIRTGAYQLKWVNSLLPTQSLLTGHPADLLVATILELPDPHDRWYRMELEQLQGDAATRWESFTWRGAPEEKLPECDLEISIRAGRSSQPFVAYFTVRPSGPWQPLEMVPVSPAIGQSRPASKHDQPPQPP